MTQPPDPPIGAMVLHENDDVAVLIRPITAGDSVMVGGARGRFILRANASLPLGHKLALQGLAAGTDVRKYGEVIGQLIATVEPGDHVHVHNLVTMRGH